MQSGFTAAIDLGTSETRGVVGRKNESGVVSVFASAAIDSQNAIRRGLVYNIEQTGANVQKLVQMLENSAGRKIGKVYVSLAGQSLYSLEIRETESLNNGVVCEETIKRLKRNAGNFRPDMKQNYKVADVEYAIDDKVEPNPVGVTGTKIEATFQLIVGRPNLLNNIRKSIVPKVNVEIADYIVGANASAAIALTPEEKELGCAFVDFGAGTTTLSVYKGGILRRMVVIPFGGKNITKDICALNMTEEKAEELKIKFGKAMEVKRDTPFFSSPFSGTSLSKPEVDITELNNVIRMRLDEIIANIQEQICLSGCDRQLGAGLIITGGASQLKNLDLYLKQELKMSVRKTSAKKTAVNNAPELINDPAYTQVLGMLLCGDEDCERIVVEPPAASAEDAVEMNDPEDPEAKAGGWLGRAGKRTPKKEGRGIKKDKPGGGLFSKMGNMFGELFTEEDDE